jgi:chloride channel protein, CIC family
VFAVSGAVGVLAGLLAAALRFGVETLFALRAQWIGALAQSPPGSWLLPALVSGAFAAAAVWGVARLAPEAAGSGVQEIEGALQRTRALRGRVLPVKFAGALLSLGGGLVLGREGPTVQIGGAVGRIGGDALRLSAEEREALVAAGAAAGLSAAFNAPLSGILFVIEEMRPHFRYNFLSVQCVLLASAAADIVARAASSQGPVIVMPAYAAPPLGSLWLFVLFGALVGLLGVAFGRLIVATLDAFEGRPELGPGARGLLAGAAVGLLSVWRPDATGGGYAAVHDALQAGLPLATLLALLGARFGATLLSYGCGAPGGIFAPMLALGTLAGMAFGSQIAGSWPGTLEPGMFAVAGMAALFSATVRAPLTGIALAVEMTSDFAQILPLILTCLTATFVAEALGGRPIYAVLLERTLEREGRRPGSAPR